MKRYEIELTKRALSALRALPKSEQRKIQAALELLKTNPIPPAAKKLKGSDHYRVRVGDYRVIYDVFANKLRILVLDMGHRREIYR